MRCHDLWLAKDNRFFTVDIVPEWYFLCQYAMLKAVPNKNAGFIILLTSIFTFFFFAIDGEKIGLARTRFAKKPMESQRQSAIFQRLERISIFRIHIMVHLGLSLNVIQGNQRTAGSPPTACYSRENDPRLFDPHGRTQVASKLISGSLLSHIQIMP